MARILVIEDNEDLAFGLRHNLELEGHSVVVEADGVAGLKAATDGQHDLILLDLMLPGLDGFEILARLRQTDADTPVLILSARGEELDKVRGLRGGADDYLTKPFGLMELLARVDALVRRSAGALSQRFEFGTVMLDCDTHRCTRDGETVTLAPKEFDLLLALLRREGRLASRLELLREVWGHTGEVQTRTVDTHILELRRKLEADPADPVHILTVRKQGYRLQV
jgi:DNA-binding response OmpR family regulator